MPEYVLKICKIKIILLNSDKMKQDFITFLKLPSVVKERYWKDLRKLAVSALKL